MRSLNMVLWERKLEIITMNKLPFLILPICLVGCASMSVKTTPPQADVLLYSSAVAKPKSIGKTPLSVSLSEAIDGLDAKAMTMVIQKEGFHPKAFLIPIFNHGHLNLDASLEKITLEEKKISIIADKPIDVSLETQKQNEGGEKNLRPLPLTMSIDDFRFKSIRIIDSTIQKMEIERNVNDDIAIKIFPGQKITPKSINENYKVFFKSFEYLSDGDFEKTLSLVAQLKKNLPEISTIHLLESIALIAQGETKKALNSLNIAKSLDPENDEIDLMISRVMEMKDE